MAFWIWGTILLATGLFLLIYIRAEVIIDVREDKSLKGISLKIHSLFYKLNKQYDYTDPHLRLMESILISALIKSSIRINTQNASSFDYKKILAFLKDFSSQMQSSLTLKNRKILALVLRFAIVERLEWNSTVGSRDALHTALAAGAGWALQGMIIGLLSNKCRLQRVKMDVRPDYTAPAFFSRISCILKMRLVHIMIIELYTLVLKVRWCINGIAAGTVQASH